MPSRAQLAVLAFLVFVPLAALLLAVPPIGQDPGYHAFADSRAAFGIPNALNVASNLAFLIVGVAGVVLCASGRCTGAARAWGVFFAATALVAAGSAYYHWAPDSETLVWDRLPMALAFMALISAVVSEHVNEKLEVPLLVVTLPLAIASVAWWRFTGDLRVYVWVQFGPLLALLYIMAALPRTFTRRRDLAYAAAFYALAKVFELTDAATFDLTRIVSGHTLKHLAAALAVLCIYRMLRRRSGTR
jgi:hypothetical protein